MCCDCGLQAQQCRAADSPQLAEWQMHGQLGGPCMGRAEWCNRQLQGGVKLKSACICLLSLMWHVLQAACAAG